MSAASDSSSYGDRVAVTDDAKSWLECDQRLVEFVRYVAAHTNWPILVDVYHDYEGGWEELHVHVLAKGEFDDLMREWGKLEEGIAGEFPLDVQMKAAVIYEFDDDITTDYTVKWMIIQRAGPRAEPGLDAAKVVEEDRT